MQIHRIRGRDLKDALERAQRQYGADALVLSRETMPDGGVTVAVADPTRALAAAKLAQSVPQPVPARERGCDDVERVLRRSGASEGCVALTLDAVARSGARGPFALDAAAEALASSVEIAPSPRIQRRAPGVLVQPCVIAFVGPTGVGKTTTLAKLAARLVRSGRRVGIVSMDTHRPGAVEQLRALASAILTDVAMAGDGAELQRAVASFGSPECVLVDTAGVSPRDSAALAALGESLAAVGGSLETYLVLQATSSREAIEAARESFAATNPSAWVLTKLDETRAPSPVLECAAAARARLAFLCDGQDVAAHLHRAEPKHVADLFLRGRIA
ncbi:MAG: hypothetical protein FJ294_00215 [Planctomycetes bacterium]|nr:hypothetical protein [Planctomycetota bacterium]